DQAEAANVCPNRAAVDYWGPRNGVPVAQARRGAPRGDDNECAGLINWIWYDGRGCGDRRMNRTLFEKAWSEHVIVTSPQGEDLLYVDFNLINEGQSFLAFDQLRKEGRRARRLQQHLAVTDHYLPTVNRSLGPAGISNAEIRRVVEMLDENAGELALPHIGWHHRDQGIAHVIAP